MSPIFAWLLYLTFTSLSLLLVMAGLATTRANWRTLQRVKSPVQQVTAPEEPFCSLVQVQSGTPGLSLLLQEPCVYSISLVKKGYSKNKSRIYLDEISQAEITMISGDWSFEIPERDTGCFWILPEYHYHKWVGRALPETIRKRLETLDIDPDFWKGLRSCTVDIKEKIIPTDTPVWVCGRLVPQKSPEPEEKKSSRQPAPYRLAGHCDLTFPLIAVTHKDMKQQAFFDWMMWLTGSLSLTAFTAFVSYLFFFTF
ncbi:hypothetical protein LZ24_00333 [Desulfobotulus alkaliphilus]|uniref:Uncharacterized protein n=1 Tax=Desulfobotulus alkaliphilus TaxID=622671 RepID=A0A562S5Z3_9BACT|nr:hypothetical protein [Desulfobotulus alkaliphilus]TWI76712.1 hypothetical protein LZ24_00333 [Desulfobotulus alkaliphilus]